MANYTSIRLLKLALSWSIHFIKWQPVTWRGLILFSASFITIYYWGAPLSDLTARILGCAGCLLFGISLILLILGRVALKTAHLEAHFMSEGVLSNSKTTLGITIRNLILLPLLSLEITPLFKHKGAVCSQLWISSHQSPARPLHLAAQTILPHRGVWEVIALRLCLADRFGLFQLSWTVPQNATIEATAPTISIQPLPILTASSRQGEFFSQLPNHRGDMFDTKTYDPSDGLSRILWKTFARTGELIVRRPEPALFPEGKVGVFLIANRDDDHVSGCLQCYLFYLAENETAIAFGTDGLSALNNTPSASSANANENALFSLSPHAIISAINAVIWSEDLGTGKHFAQYLDSLARSQDSFERIMIFAPENDKSGWMDQVRQTAEQRGVALTITVVPDHLRSFTGAPVAKSSQIISTINFLKRFSRPNTRNIQTRQKNISEIAVSGGSGIQIEHCQALEMA